MEKTLAIIKPDAVGKKYTGEILNQIEKSGLQIVALKRLDLSERQAQAFYDVHKSKPFYKSLCDYMTSGPVVIAVLSGERAIERWRNLMGATDPAKAAAGTIRKQFGTSIEQNATHGSDAPETAAREVTFFFSGLEITA